MRRTRIVIRKAGGLDALEAVRDEAPAPSAGEVAVAVEAAGINYADCVVRRGLYRSARDYVGWPITPGFEVAGRVAAVGPGVQSRAVGEPVIAVTRFGGYASHLVAPEHQVFARPRGLSAPEAAALPTVFLTAWYALVELARPRPGQRVLIHSAAGGVGSAAVQVARILGAEVTGVVGASHKVEPCEALGAEHVIDKSGDDLWARAEAIAPGGFDVILDANGVSTLGASYAHLRRPGKLVVYGFASMLPRDGQPINWLRLGLDYLRTPRFNPLTLTNDCVSILAFNLSYLFDERELLAEGMQRILTWTEEGRIRPPQVTTFPLAEAGRAQGELESGRTVGKLVLVP